MRTDDRSKAQRFIDVNGPLSRERGHQVAAQLKAFLAESTRPVTIRINSFGGHVSAFLEITRRCQLHQTGRACKITTVASEACSAAAYLLVTGDRASASPRTVLGFHGASFPSLRRTRLRTERALLAAIRLDRANRRIAKRLAGHIALRLSARAELPVDDREATEVSAGARVRFIDQLVHAIAARLEAEDALTVLNDTAGRFNHLYGLVVPLLPEAPPGRLRDALPVDHKLLQAVVVNEVVYQGTQSFPIDSTAAAELMIDYVLCRDLVRSRREDLIDELSRSLRRQWGPVMSERATRSYATTLWHFAIVMCSRLLSGENKIPAPDAIWLGLIDELFEPGAQAVTATNAGTESGIVKARLKRRHS